LLGPVSVKLPAIRNRQTQCESFYHLIVSP
jgi:hypothetical protein